MISELLDRDYVLAQGRAQRDWLADLLAKARKKNPAACATMKKYGVTARQIGTAIAALDSALAQAATSHHEANNAFIPSNPILCSFQAGMTEMAERRANTISTPSSPVALGAARTTRGPARAASGRAPVVIDTSPTEHLKRRSDAAPDQAAIRAPFIEGDDIHYGLDGFQSKFGALFKGRRAFNKQPATPAVSTQPLRIFVFGDWGSGLPLAQMVTQQIRRQLDAGDGTRQQHVVHLGDVYYCGEKEEYMDRVVAAGMWPVTGAETEKIGSWSLNGNHDMYAGGHGYFDTLLRDGRFLRWHRDAAGEPSSFFVIEDKDWQIFGLDTSWNLPSLSSAIFGEPTLKDFGGQNGILTKEQVKWMAARRDVTKGCVLLTHHQPAASRRSEKQHADEAVKLLRQAGVYEQIDAWLWGHEHRCVVFKPKEERTVPRLASAPNFCACIGHGGIPVTAKNFGPPEDKIDDIAWEEDRMDETSPIYEKERILPFGFARIDTAPGALDIRIFDHTGEERYQTTFVRIGATGAHKRHVSAAAQKKNPQAREKPATAPTSKKGIKAKAPAKEASPVGRNPVPPRAQLQAEWTILVYMAGDNNLDSFGGDDIREMKQVGSTEKVNVVVQRDSPTAGGYRYLLQRGTTMKEDERGALGQINTGDPRVLEDFLVWGLTQYPAKRTMVVMWNHGSGWDDTDIYAAARARGLNPRPVAGNVPRMAVSRAAGKPRTRSPFFLTAFTMAGADGQRRAIAFDDSAQDFLDSVELKKVFAAVAKKAKKKFDVIGMDACLMSMVENGLQLQDSGEVFCGSQEVEPANGWPYDRILHKLTTTPTMTGSQLCSMIVKEFVESYGATEVVTQSAFDLASLTAVRKQLDALGDILAAALANPSDLATEGAVNRARKQAQKYDHPDYVDAWDFSARLAALWPAAGPTAAALQQAIQACVFANEAPHANVSRSHGLSIYLPVEKVNPLYARLDIAGGGWAKFLQALRG